MFNHNNLWFPWSWWEMRFHQIPPPLTFYPLVLFPHTFHLPTHLIPPLPSFSRHRLLKSKVQSTWGVEGETTQRAVCFKPQLSIYLSTYCWLRIKCIVNVCEWTRVKESIHIQEIIRNKSNFMILTNIKIKNLKNANYVCILQYLKMKIISLLQWVLCLFNGSF